MKLFLLLLLLLVVGSVVCESTKAWPDDSPSPSTYQPSYLSDATANGGAAHLWHEQFGGVWTNDEFEKFASSITGSQNLFVGESEMVVLYEQKLGDGTWDQMGIIGHDGKKFRIITNTARHVGLIRVAADSNDQPPSARIRFVGELVPDYPIVPASLELKVKFRRNGVIQDTHWLVVCDGRESLDQSDWLEWDNEKLEEFYRYNCDYSGHPLETIAVLAANARSY